MFLHERSYDICTIASSSNLFKHLPKPKASSYTWSGELAQAL